jgi:acyl carrier protein
MSIETDQLREAVREYILREFLPGESSDKLSDTTPLITGGILDSLGTLRLIAFLEESYNIEVGADEVVTDNLNTVGLITNFIEHKRH